MADGGGEEELLAEALARAVGLAAEQARPPEVAERDRLSERVADAACHRQARLELPHGIVAPTLREPDPAAHDPDHRTAERDVELLGEVEGTLGVLFRGLEVGRHLRELRHGE